MHHGYLSLGGCINSFINMKNPENGTCAIVDTGVRHIVRHIEFLELLLFTLLSKSPVYTIGKIHRLV